MWEQASGYGWMDVLYHVCAFSYFIFYITHAAGLAVTARVAFLTADAVMHEAFAADDAERGALLAELERALRASLGA